MNNEPVPSTKEEGQAGGQWEPDQFGLWKKGPKTNCLRDDKRLHHVDRNNLDCSCKRPEMKGHSGAQAGWRPRVKRDRETDHYYPVRANIESASENP